MLAIRTHSTNLSPDADFFLTKPGRLSKTAKYLLSTISRSSGRFTLALTALALIASCLAGANAKEYESQDRGIKGVDPKNLPFNKIIKVVTEYTDTVLCDRAIEGDMCFITCNNYNGVTSKWSNYYVDLQPFENFCMFLTGCSSQYPLPPSEVRLKVGDRTWLLKISDPAQNRYYLPLEARQAIAGKNGNIDIEIPGVKMPVYRIGAGNLPLIADVVNQTEEKQSSIDSDSRARSKEERLVELKSLRIKGLISPDEYEKARMKVIEGI
jgi:hypothetical protein